jgi:hypothetical protein
MFGLLLVGIVPATAVAGVGGPVTSNQPVRKEYFVFTTGSAIPVSINRLRGPIATTTAHLQVVRITERNRLIGPSFINAGHNFP